MTGETSAVPVGIKSETVVYHPNNTPNSLGAAEAVLRNISGPAVMALGPTTGGAQVTVLTGSDIVVMPVPPKVTTTTVKTKKPKGTTTTRARAARTIPRDRERLDQLTAELVNADAGAVDSKGPKVTNLRRPG